MISRFLVILATEAAWEEARARLAKAPLPEGADFRVVSPEEAETLVRQAEEDRTVGQRALQEMARALSDQACIEEYRPRADRAWRRARRKR